MKRPLKISLAWLLVGCALVGVALPASVQSGSPPPAGPMPAVPLADAEPTYEGKTLTEWLPDLVTAPYTPDFRRGSAAVLHMGATALPVLLKHLESQDTYVEYAETAFRILGAVAKPAVPRLQEMLRQGRDPGRTASILVALGEEGPVIQALSDPKLRLAALGALAKPSVSEAAVEPILRLLQLKDHKSQTIVASSETRTAAAKALGGIGKRLDLVVPELLCAASINPDADPAVREASQGALVGLKYPTKILFPIYLKVLTPGSGGRRAEACERLAWVCDFANEDADGVINALIARVTDPEANVRVAAVNALGKLIQGRRPKPHAFDQPATDGIVGYEARGEKIVSAFAAALRDRNEAVRRAAVESLGAIGATGTFLDRSVAKALRTATQDLSEAVRMLAKERLAEPGPAPENP